MPAPRLRLTELPVEIMEQYSGTSLGYDIMEVEMVRSGPVESYSRDFALTALLADAITNCFDRDRQ